MTAQHLAWLLLGLGSGLAGGYPWGRWVGRRKLDREYWHGWDDRAYNDAHELPLGGTLRDGLSGQPLLQEPAGGASPLDALPVPPLTDDGPWLVERQARPSALEYVPRPESTGVTGRAVPERGPGHPDWREQVAADLAPEALALDVPESGRLEVLRPDAVLAEGSGVSAVSPGLGHPSPYTGPLTPAQRRRDKHKQRGQWAAATYPEVGPPLLGPPSEWMAARIERWKHEMASIGESDWLARELTAVA